MRAAAVGGPAFVGTEEPWRAPRCLIVTGGRPFVVKRPGLWLDALHIQMPYSAVVASEDDSHVAIFAGETGSAYITNSVVQSDGRGNVVGLWSYRSPGFFVRGACALGLLIQNKQLQQLPCSGILQVSVN